MAGIQIIAQGRDRVRVTPAQAAPSPWDCSDSPPRGLRAPFPLGPDPQIHPRPPFQVHVYDPYDDDYYQTVPLDSHQAAYISSGHYGHQYGGGWSSGPGGVPKAVPLSLTAPRFPSSSRGDPRHRARGSLPRLRGPDGAGAAGRGRHRRRPGLLHVDAVLVLGWPTALPSAPQPCLGTCPESPLSLPKTPWGQTPIHTLFPAPASALNNSQVLQSPPKLHSRAPQHPIPIVTGPGSCRGCWQSFPTPNLHRELAAEILGLGARET